MKRIGWSVIEGNVLDDAPELPQRSVTYIGMIAISLSQVQTIGTIVSVAFGALSIASAWLMRTVAKKVALALVFAALALVVWTQRTQVQSCANDVKSNVLQADTTCTFFGADVTIPTGAGA